MRTVIVNPYKKGKTMRKARRKTVVQKVVRRTVRRKSNPTNRTRKTYRVAGETLYRQRPVFYSRDGRIVSKKLGRRTPRKKLNPKKGYYTMARRKRRVSRRRTRRNPFMYKARRRRVRRNPSGGGVKAIMNTLLQGLITSGTMVAGLYGGSMIANMIAGSGTGPVDPAKKAQMRNLSRAILTIASAALLPKLAPKYAESVTSGLFAATTLGFMNTSFGINLGQLAGEDYTPGLLYGGPSFNVSDDLQVGGDWELPEFSGVNELSGVDEF